LLKLKDSDEASGQRELGWERISRTLNLGKLDQDGIRDILVKLGTPLNKLADRFDMVKKLYELSEGEPLIVNLYATDLWGDKENVAYLKPEDLLDRKPGLEGYFKGWWNDQEKLWEGHISKSVKMLRNLCAFAYGPLSNSDIWQLAPSYFDNTEEVMSVAKKFERFLIKTGDPVPGYVLSHPKLAEYFRDIVVEGVDEKNEIIKQFVDYGKRTIDYLRDTQNSGKPPSEYSRYIILYYSEHLLEARKRGLLLDPDDFYVLTQPIWRWAWENLPYVQSVQRGFVDEIEKINGFTRQILDEEVSKTSSPIGNEKIQRAIGEEIRASLLLSSFYTTADTISIELLQIVSQKKISYRTLLFTHHRKWTRSNDISF
jgi:hypothetical protein